MLETVARLLKIIVKPLARFNTQFEVKESSKHVLVIIVRKT